MPKLRRCLGWIAAHAAKRVRRRQEPIVQPAPDEASNVLAFPSAKGAPAKPRPSASAEVILFPGRTTTIRPIAEPPALTG